MRKTTVKEIGKISIESLGNNKGYKIKTPEVLSDDDLVCLKVALEEIFSEIYSEVLEEKKSKGQSTYVEYRGGEVAVQY
ncbi:MAG: hypothetical protein QXK24_06495 [Ignisphaera sp.]